MKPPSARHLAWACFFLWVLAINAASMLPGDALPDEMSIPYFDKAVHFVAFIAGGALLYAALRAGPRPLGVPRTLSAFAAVSLLGAADELRQVWTPGRFGGDWWDMLANAAGAAAGVAACYFLFRAYNKLVREPGAGSAG